MSTQYRSNINSLSNGFTVNHLEQQHERWPNAAHRTEPLGLLDLPFDVLQAILKEVSHTNDLSSLALTHSAFYDLVIPHIYSRFDIVWPDANPTVESRIGVDALTYGLATLVMAHDVFGEKDYYHHDFRCQQCGHQNKCHHQNRRRKIRRGNYYAQYTKKFSLGNGPEDWVREYLITKEGGKMLGTLVALAVGRMHNLETFVWDMPTGVLRDVWLALASLADRQDEQGCKLERIWVRWHDNQDRVSLPPSTTPGTIPAPIDVPSLLTGTATSMFHIPPYPRVEFPTFSILPALKSLCVLDIDELSYVEEMSVLIGRSFAKLEELRVGVARHAQHDAWARPQEDKALVSPSLLYPNTTQPFPRPGGLLGILVGQFCPVPSAITTSAQSVTQSTDKLPTITNVEILASDSNKETSTTKQDEHAVVSGIDIDQLVDQLSAQSIGVAHREIRSEESSIALTSHIPNTRATAAKNHSEIFAEETRDNQPKRLQLRVLELERVYLSLPVLSRALDWTRLTSLSLLGCRNHDQLWKALRRKFLPMTRRRTLSSSLVGTTSNITPSQRSVSSPLTNLTPASDYKLKILRLHTDTVSSSLLAFIKDALAPDTLEWLFLQQTESYKSTVTTEQIYKCAIRPHRNSLRKLLVDSDIRAEDRTASMNWRRWVFGRELISSITNGRMQLRELSISIEYQDWHYLLQRLPGLATMRSLHITHIADYVYGRIDCRDLAQQFLDIVSLRPEIQLCYVGILNKCFEILELSSSRSCSPAPRMVQTAGTTQSHIDDDNDDDHSDENDNQADDGDDNSSDSDTNTNHDEVYDISDDEAVADQITKPVFKLREILFYDDKISIFKARHGKL